MTPSVWDDLTGLNVTRTTADTLKLQSLLRFHTVSVHLSACIICLSCCSIYHSINCSMSICLFCLSIYLSIYLSVCLSVCILVVLLFCVLSIFIYSWMNGIKMVEGHF